MRLPTPRRNGAQRTAEGPACGPGHGDTGTSSRRVGAIETCASELDGVAGRHPIAPQARHQTRGLRSSPRTGHGPLVGLWRGWTVPFAALRSPLRTTADRRPHASLADVTAQRSTSERSSPPPWSSSALPLRRRDRRLRATHQRRRHPRRTDPASCAHGDVAAVIVRVDGSSVCSGTPITDTRLVITAAHCVLDNAGDVTAVTVVRDGVEHSPHERSS